MTTRRKMGARAHTAMLRKGRLQTEWSMANAQLGGVDYRDHPWCATIQHYYLRAPYETKAKPWSRFRAWMKVRVDEARVFGG